MRYTFLPFALMASVLMSGATLADGNAYDNPDVVKLPAPTGEQVLLYPGGQYGRVVQYGLKQPGAASAPIHLHRPGKHHYTIPANPAAEPAPYAPAHRTTPGTETALAPIHLKKPVHHTAAPKLARAEPAPRHAAATVPQKPAAPVVKKIAKAAPPVMKPAPKPEKAIVTSTPKAPPPPAKETVRVASAEPQTRHIRPASAPRMGAALAEIPFAQSASQPIGQTLNQINALAQDLTGRISGRKRVQILAYAGPKDSRTSTARRLSLKRALIVRQLLIDGGVPSDRIDVRAMGGVTDDGATERVDVFLSN